MSNQTKGSMTHSTKLPEDTLYGYVEKLLLRYHPEPEELERIETDLAYRTILHLVDQKHSENLLLARQAGREEGEKVNSRNLEKAFNYLRAHEWCGTVDGWIYRQPKKPINQEDMDMYLRFGELSMNEAITKETT